MRQRELKRITTALRQLTPDQRKHVAVELAAGSAQSASTVIVEGRFACGATCPHCKSIHVIRNGHANGLQRHHCGECWKTFSALTGTSLIRLYQRRKWLDQAKALQVGQALREVASTFYLGWFRAIDRERGNGLKPQQWLTIAIGGMG